jgi:hypothetical protein
LPPQQATNSTQSEQAQPNSHHSTHSKSPQQNIPHLSKLAAHVRLRKWNIRDWHSEELAQWLPTIVVLKLE